MNHLPHIIVALGLASTLELQAGELHNACRRGDIETAKKIVEANPTTVNQPDNSKLTPLMLAARTNGALVEYLLEKGADPKATMGTGATALHLAAVAHNVESMSALLKHGADVNARESYNNTPALLAANKRGPGRKDALKLLVENKADLTIKDKDGSSIPLLAGRDPELAKILKEIKAKY
jgi:uncharacterized protein